MEIQEFVQEAMKGKFSEDGEHSSSLLTPDSGKSPVGNSGNHKSPDHEEEGEEEAPVKALDTSL